MKNLIKLWTLSLIGTAFCYAQQVTPNTTLCASMTATATSVCLTATTGSSPSWSIVNQTGIYVDNEYMVVVLANSQTISGTSQYVPVLRGSRSGLGAPTAHNNSAVAWIAIVPTEGAFGVTNLAGVNGFSYDTSVKLVGPCTRASQPLLPVILVDLAQKRDCSANNTSTVNAGNWVDFNDYGDPMVGTLQVLTAATITVAPTSGNYLLNGTATETVTVAAPTATIQDGTILRFSSFTAHAHVISMSGLIENGATGSPFATATLAAFPGASITFMAFNGKWLVISSVGTVTYA